MKRGEAKNKNKIYIISIILILVALAIIFFLYNNKPKDPSNPSIQNNSINNSIPLSNQNHEVKIRSYKFYPDTLKIKVGDTVNWTNNNVVNHTITSDSGRILDSKSFGNGDSFAYKFNQEGAYTYHCSLHSRMEGTIIVE